MKLLIDYEQLATNAAAAMRRVIALLARAGAQVIETQSDGRTRRIAGVSFREVTFTFADSQKLALRVKATGDIYEVRVNGKVTPVKEQDDFTKSVAELAGLMDKGRVKFQKRLAAIQMRPPEGIRTAAPKLLQALQAQVAQLDEEIVTATDELAALQA